MRVLDLFSGIGGFSLGLERAGMRTVAFCEIDSYCRAVLRKHWPEVPCYEDVRLLTGERLRADGISVDAICGGFPCQDISFAGRGAGLAGERSGLWVEYARLIRELRPPYVIVENVSALLGRGLGRVLGDLAAIRYDAEWHCVPASAVGAPHRRDRVWIVAYASSERPGEAGRLLGEPAARPAECGQVLADADIDARNERGPRYSAEVEGRRHSDRGAFGQNDLAHADEPRLQRWIGEILRECPGEWTARPSSPLENAASEGRDSTRSTDAREAPAGRTLGRFGRSSGWLVEPDVGRVAHGIPARVERLRALGNAVVPQIPEIIGRAIMNFEASK